MQKSLKGEAFGLMVIFQKIFAPVPGFNRRKLDGQSFLEEALDEKEVDFPVVAFEVGSDVIHELSECLETQIDEQYQGVIEDAVFIYFEDIFQKQSEIRVVEDDEFVDRFEEYGERIVEPLFQLLFFQWF